MKWHRRSVLGFIGAAPAAAVVKAAPAEAVPTPPEVPWVIRGRLAGSATRNNGAMYYNEYGEPIEDLGKEIANRKLRLKAWRKKRELGINDSVRSHGHCPCIESRKATSAAIKALLQEDHVARQTERELENQVARLEMLDYLPSWLREWVRM